MTEIKLHTYGEKLIVSEKVTIASGDINSAKLVVEFDEAWDGYPARTAILKNDKVTGDVEVLMVGNECTIPPEVLQKNGTLKIAVRAATTNGTDILTSSVIAYTIVEGASPGTTTLTPPMDLYQQYLAAMKGEYDPLSLALKADYNAFTANILNILSGDVLWTNPDSTVEFAAQTVALDLAEYKRIKIIFIDDLSSDSYRSESECSRKDVTYHIHCITEGTSSRAIYRPYTFTDTGIVFGSGYWENEEDTERCIPVEIIGYKY